MPNPHQPIDRTTAAAPSPSLGSPIPALTPHAVSVSLPKWADNVDYEEGRQRVVGAMQTGYPRFFIHRDIQKLAEICLTRFGLPSESCLLFPSSSTASSCKAFLSSPLRGPDSTSSRIVRFCVRPSTGAGLVPCPPSTTTSNGKDREEAEGEGEGEEDLVLHVVFFPKLSFPLAKSYWQHTGHGVSSRLAERCLRLLGSCPVREEASTSTSTGVGAVGSGATEEGSAVDTGSGTGGIKSRYGRNRHLAPSRQPSLPSSTLSSSITNLSSLPTPPLTPPVLPPSTPAGEELEDNPVEPETGSYLEERYGRNLALRQGGLAKTALKRRIAGVLRTSASAAGEGKDRRGSSVSGLDGRNGSRVNGDASPNAHAHAHVNGTSHPTADPDEALATSSFLEPSERAGGQLTEQDVFLYPGGMTAIFHAHQLVLSLRHSKPGKSVCFGFPYTDTLKILQKWGPGCHFFGHGTASDLDRLEELLASQRASSSQTEDEDEGPIQALFCEFPSNPLLRSPDLERIKRLADEYNFVVVVDETIGNFVNVEVLPFADVVVSSLTKVFSGDSNVMGGSLVLSPTSKHYATLKKALQEQYEDIYFSEDAIYMERNSRDFRPRIQTINRNASLICTYLHSLTSPSSPSSSVKKVYYPKYSDTKGNYDARLRKEADHSEPGYGGLFSVTFRSLAASSAFFDALPSHKGPSLGTNFTLACPYTVLAHYLELEWAAGWGVEEGLVRVSVGLEGEEVLKGWFEKAVEAGDEAWRKEREALAQKEGKA